MAAPHRGLLDGYGEERRPVGLDVVERTTHRMDESLVSGDVKFDQWLADSQLLIHYRDSRWVGRGRRTRSAGEAARGPATARPTRSGLRLDWIAHPIRLAERMRVPGHLLLLYFDADARAADFARAAELADLLAARHGDDVTIDGIVAPGARGGRPRALPAAARRGRRVPRRVRRERQLRLPDPARSPRRLALRPPRRRGAAALPRADPAPRLSTGERLRG